MNSEHSCFQLVHGEEPLTPHRALGAVRVEAPAPSAGAARAPLCLLACIDVSGSMEGEKLVQVKFALDRLVEQLAPSDSFGIVAFSDESFDVLPVSPMDDTGKDLARRAVAGLHALDTTNMSGGLARSLAVANACEGPANAIRRVILFTDGRANDGLSEQDVAGWRRLLDSARGSASVSWFGFGEDHNADLLATLATFSAGNYVRASSEEAIRDAFAVELGGLLSVALAKVRITIEPSSAVHGLEVLNEVRAQLTGEQIAIELPDLIAGEVRYLAFEVHLHPIRPAGAAAPFVDVSVSWSDATTGQPHTTRLSASDATSGSAELREHVALIRAARAQAEAAKLCEKGDYRAARALVLAAAEQLVRVGTPRAAAVAKLLSAAAELYRPQRYESSMAQLMSMRTSIANQRTSGSDADDLFETREQARMRTLFRDSSSPKRKH